MHDELCINNWESALGTELCNCEYIEHIRADERKRAAQRVAAKRNYAFTDDVFGALIIRDMAIAAARGGEH